MHYPEEDYAKALFTRLSGELASAAPDAAASLSGAGVAWRCTAAKGERSCVIDCFHVRQPDGPQYSASFRHGTDTAAVGRTRSVADVAAATVAWLEGHRREELHRRYGFVDRAERSLTTLPASVIDRCPALGRLASHDVQPRASDLAQLRFTASDRSFEASFYGGDTTPTGYFSWDGFLLFEMRTADPDLLAGVLGRWLCGRAMPSAMVAEFPFIEMREAARYHEEGRPLEGEFLASWDRIEAFYREFTDWPAVVTHVLPFVRQARAAGFDRVLRAGQSMATLVVSRSKQHGLRGGQPCVAFAFGPAGMDVHVYGVRDERLRSRPVELTPGVRALLQRLASAEVD